MYTICAIQKWNVFNNYHEYVWFNITNIWNKPHLFLLYHISQHFHSDNTKMHLGILNCWFWNTSVFCECLGVQLKDQEFPFFTLGLGKRLKSYYISIYIKSFGYFPASTHFRKCYFAILPWRVLTPIGVKWDNLISTTRHLLWQDRGIGFAKVTPSRLRNTRILDFAFALCVKMIHFGAGTHHADGFIKRSRLWDSKVLRIDGKLGRSKFF